MSQGLYYGTFPESGSYDASHIDNFKSVVTPDSYPQPVSSAPHSPSSLFSCSDGVSSPDPQVESRSTDAPTIVASQVEGMHTAPLATPTFINVTSGASASTAQPQLRATARKAKTKKPVEAPGSGNYGQFQTIPAPIAINPQSSRHSPALNVVQQRPTMRTMFIHDNQSRRPKRRLEDEDSQPPRIAKLAKAGSNGSRLAPSNQTPIMPINRGTHRSHTTATSSAAPVNTRRPLQHTPSGLGSGILRPASSPTVLQNFGQATHPTLYDQTIDALKAQPRYRVASGLLAHSTPLPQQGSVGAQLRATTLNNLETPHVSRFTLGDCLGNALACVEEDDCLKAISVAIQRHTYLDKDRLIQSLRRAISQMTSVPLTSTQEAVAGPHLVTQSSTAQPAAAMVHQPTGFPVQNGIFPPNMTQSSGQAVPLAPMMHLDTSFPQQTYHQHLRTMQSAPSAHRGATSHNTHFAPTPSVPQPGAQFLQRTGNYTRNFDGSNNGMSSMPAMAAGADPFQQNGSVAAFTLPHTQQLQHSTQGHLFNLPDSYSASGNAQVEEDFASSFHTIGNIDPRNFPSYYEHPDVQVG